MPRPPHIGTLREKPLHASLKEWYSVPGDRLEVPVDGYVVDIVRDGLLIEIQTRGFSSMRAKVAALLDSGHDLRIVHPIPAEKWIVKIGEDGEILDRRRSPKRGHPVDIAAELVSFPRSLDHPGLEVEAVLTMEEELRVHDPGRAWRRRGWVVAERKLVEVVDTMRLKGVADLGRLLPRDLPVPFTTADLASSLGRHRRIAQQLAYCLRETGFIEVVGNTRAGIEYRLA